MGKVPQMAIGPEVDINTHGYKASFSHTPTGVVINCEVAPPMGPNPTEAQRDLVFQAFVTKMSELSNVIVNSAVKTTTYTSQVTA